MIHYEVSVVDFITNNDTFEMSHHAPRKWRFRNLAAARRKATKLARRGRNLYGGTVIELPWGARGGSSLVEGTYRSVVIGVAIPLRGHQKKAIQKLVRQGSTMEVPRGLWKSDFVPETCDCPTCEGAGCGECQGTGKVFL
jgi:hypothetical protein